MTWGDVLFSIFGIGFLIAAVVVALIRFLLPDKGYPRD